MDIVDIILKVILTLCSIFLIVLVLLQQGKGADAGAAFGSGASQTVFGSSGSGNFLTKSTWWLGMVFFACALALAFKAQDRDMKYESEGVEMILPGVVDQSSTEDPDLAGLPISPSDSTGQQSNALEVSADAPLSDDTSSASSSDIPVVSETAGAAQDVDKSVSSEKASSDAVLNE